MATVAMVGAGLIGRIRDKIAVSKQKRFAWSCNQASSMVRLIAGTPGVAASRSRCP